MLASYTKSLRATFIVGSFLSIALCALAQSAGNSTSVVGTVTDPSGAVVPGALVEFIIDLVSRAPLLAALGAFAIPNVPCNPYHFTATSQGFAPFTQDIDVRSVVPVTVSVALKLQSSETVTVESGGEDLLENDPTFHTDVDKSLFDKFPLESQSSSLSSLVTLATPGISADSNGSFHGLVIMRKLVFQWTTSRFQINRARPSRIKSRWMPFNRWKWLPVPTRRIRRQTSIVINHHSVGPKDDHPARQRDYLLRQFWDLEPGLQSRLRRAQVGNFISVGGLDSGRFLDPPEFSMKCAGETNRTCSTAWTINLPTKIPFTSTWGSRVPGFRIRSFDQQDATAWNGVVVSNGGLGPDGLPVGATDQRSQIQDLQLRAIVDSVGQQYNGIHARSLRPS
jgi:hypothetical protein